MSKNIVIQEGGVGKQLTANKLKTNLVGGGTCLWVPEDETRLGTKHISENGTYKASDDGYYGYEQVVINITGVGTATGTDGDGDEVVAHTDPETGELEIDKVPSRIGVIEPPTNPYGIYTNGQAINTNGMVVRAYLASGGEYGTVPNREITLDPTTAIYDKSTDYGSGGTATSDLDTHLVQPIAYTGQAIRVSDPDGQGRTIKFIYSAQAIAGFPISNDPNRFGMLFASSSSPAYEYSETWRDGSEGHNKSTGGTTAYTYDGKTVYYGTMNTERGNGWSTPENALKDGGNIGASAWTMIYGTREETQAGSRQTIKVSWPRPLDGKVLETTFEILVAPPYSTEE